MSTGADNKSLPGTPEYRDNFDRIFGKDRQPERGRWIVDPATNTLVPADEYVPTTSEARVPVLTDRYMEGVCAVDGTDISSRSKRRAYMKQNDLADADDFKNEWKKKAEERAAIHISAVTGKPVGRDSKKRREVIERAVYELSKNKKR